MTGPRLPKKITVDLATSKLFIDDEEFPWFISSEGVDISRLGDPEYIPQVTITLLANTVEVIPKEPTP